MIKIEIESTDLREFKGVSAKNNKPYHLRMQSAYAFIVGPDGKAAKYPEKFELMLDADQTPYPAGVYQLHPSAISVRDGRMTITPNLAPVAKA
jgi:hypothetical protein